MWIKVEGLPLLYNKMSVARRALDILGKVLFFDEESTSDGFKDFLRAKVEIPINNPLVPGVYFNRQEGPRAWVDFRYEGVFVYCSKCGRIGHKRPRCRIPIAIAQHHFEMVLDDIGQGIFPPIVSPSIIPLFTNKLIGLKRIERNRTTKVNLLVYIQGRDIEGDSISERTIEDDNFNDHNSDSSDSSGPGGPPNPNVDHKDRSQGNREAHQGNFSSSNIHDPNEAGSSKRKRVSNNSHQEGGKRHRTCIPSGLNSSIHARKLRRRSRILGTVANETKKTKDHSIHRVEFAKSSHSLQYISRKRMRNPAELDFNGKSEEVKGKKKGRVEALALKVPNPLIQEAAQRMAGKFLIASGCIVLKEIYDIAHFSSERVIL